jgi:UDP-glucose 4-epimerase
MAELCLVTGGAGFIGSHLVEALTARGHRVRVLDDLSTGLTENLAHIDPAPQIVEGSVADLWMVQGVMAGVGVVYHLAALASVQKSLEAPDETHAVCATGTLNVLSAARAAGVRRAVFVGSASAYGNYSSEVGLTEDTPLNPLSPYAAAKLAGEMYAQSFTTSFGLETARVRFFNVFGPRQRADSPYSGVIALFIAAMSAGKVPTIFGDGLQSRDFVYVTDAVQALMKAADRPGVAGKVFNIATGNSISLLDLVASLNRLLGKNIVPRHGPERGGDVRFSKADITRARTELGYHPAVPFEEGLKHTLGWYQESDVVKGR